MSYILEALKKSDKERRGDEIPGLEADHSSSLSRRKKRKPLLWLVLAIIIVLLCCVVGLFFWWKLSADQVAPPLVSLPVPEQSRSTKSQAVEQTEEKISVPDEIVPAVTPKQSSFPPFKKASVQAEKPLPPLLEELSLSVRAGIPELSFAGHVYSDTAAKRMIIINSRIVREGDLVSDGLSLEQIDPDGVVLRYEGSVFRVKLF